MAKVIIGATVSEEVRDEAQEVLTALGFTMSQAIRMFIKQLIAQRKMPFDINFTADESEIRDNQC